MSESFQSIQCQIRTQHCWFISYNSANEFNNKRVCRTIIVVSFKTMVDEESLTGMEKNKSLMLIKFMELVIYLVINTLCFQIYKYSLFSDCY